MIIYPFETDLRSVLQTFSLLVTFTRSIRVVYAILQDTFRSSCSLSLEVNTRFNSLQSYTCLSNPMIIVKLTSKVHKNMFEHAKNKKNWGGGVSLDSLAALAPSALEEPT